MKMNELLERYIGENCIIETDTGIVNGCINKITDNWMEVETTVDKQIVNTDFVISIKGSTVKKPCRTKETF